MPEPKDEFVLDDDLVYLNHAAVAPWPRRTAAAVAAFADENMRRGAHHYPRWLGVERRLRGRLQRLVGAASSDDIALVKNTSEGLSLIATGLPWQPGDNIVSTDQEFPSNRIVWQALADSGVELRQADVSCDDPEAAMVALMDARTRLLAVSSVQFGTGLRMDLARLGEACRERGVLFCVDAIQSLGALRFDARACHADFVVADGHKWMLGPEGLALFYAQPEARERLQLRQFGWHMVEHAGDFDRRDWQPAASARRFEPGSPNMLAIHALDASLSLLEETGMATVETELLARSERVMQRVLAEPSLQLLSREEPFRRSGIVTFRVKGLDRDGHQALYHRLMRQGVVCAMRGGGIRFSPHYYTPPQAMESAWAQVLL